MFECDFRSDDLLIMLTYCNQNLNEGFKSFNTIQLVQKTERPGKLNNF